ncbi:MAG: HU family DNA-binding protein, partial [Bacteroidales bacterium]
LIQKGNPRDPKAPQKYYAVARAEGEVSLKELSREIAETSTVNDTDVLAVLNDLTKILCKHLGHGRIVRLGEFGTLNIVLHSEGAETEEKFNVHLIKRSKIHFRPGEDLAEMLGNMKYEKQKDKVQIIEVSGSSRKASKPKNS